MRYAMIIVATVPIMCVYPFVQKYFDQGVMIGAVKGCALFPSKNQTADAV